jgi:hypothetical protein
MSTEDKLRELLRLALPALRVSVVLSRSDASETKRRCLLYDVEKALESAVVPSDCTNPDCEEGSVFEDCCSECEQPIGTPCPICRPADYANNQKAKNR